MRETGKEPREDSGEGGYRRGRSCLSEVSTWSPEVSTFWAFRGASAPDWRASLDISAVTLVARIIGSEHWCSLPILGYSLLGAGSVACSSALAECSLPMAGLPILGHSLPMIGAAGCASVSGSQHDWGHAPSGPRMQCNASRCPRRQKYGCFSVATLRISDILVPALVLRPLRHSHWASRVRCECVCACASSAQTHDESSRKWPWSCSAPCSTVLRHFWGAS